MLQGLYVLQGCAAAGGALLLFLFSETVLICAAAVPERTEVDLLSAALNSPGQINNNMVANTRSKLLEIHIFVSSKQALN